MILLQHTASIGSCDWLVHRAMQWSMHNEMCAMFSVCIAYIYWRRSGLNVREISYMKLWSPMMQPCPAWGTS